MNGSYSYKTKIPADSLHCVISGCFDQRLHGVKFSGQRNIWNGGFKTSAAPMFLNLTEGTPITRYGSFSH